MTMYLMTPLKNKTFTLINLGGPRTKDEIEIFLKDLFLDPYVFDLPLWEPFRKLLAKYIAKTRAPKVAFVYDSMGYGGGSPLVEETEKQKLAIEKVLFKKTKESWVGSIAMACGYPNIRDHLTKDIFPSANNIHIPLFPQFSRSTTLSIAASYQKKTGNCPLGQIGFVDPFALDERFIHLTAEFIYDFLNGSLTDEEFPHYKNRGKISSWEKFDLVFSAHGIPMRLVDKGDQYVVQMQECVTRIENALRLKGYEGELHLSFQSKVGRGKWTEPNTKQMLIKLGNLHRQIAVYPISFVGDHLETLEEIGVELRELALSAGAKDYVRIPAFGVYPKFIEFIADLILEAQNKKKNTECLCKKMGGESLTGCHFE